MKTPINNPMQTAVSPREAARISGLSHATIARCFDKGLLKGYKIPGSRFRRIPIANLHRFLRAHGIPFEGRPVLDAEHVDAFMRMFRVEQP